MRTTYRRFKELREKAQEELDGHGVLEDQLTNALCELNYLHESDVPEHKWEDVQTIINSCRTVKAGDAGKVGVFKASIIKMTLEERSSLKRAIEYL